MHSLRRRRSQWPDPSFKHKHLKLAFVIPIFFHACECMLYMGLTTVTAVNSVCKEPSTGLVPDTLGISEWARAFPRWRKAGKMTFRDWHSLSSQISLSHLIIQWLTWQDFNARTPARARSKNCLRKTDAFRLLFRSSFNNVLKLAFSNVWGSAGKQDIHQIDRQSKLQGKENLNVSPKLMVLTLVGSGARHMLLLLVWSHRSSIPKMERWWIPDHIYTPSTIHQG